MSRVSVTLICICLSSFFFFFNDTATTEIYTLSLHDALPISRSASASSTAPRSLRRSACCSCSRSEEHTSELQSHSDLVCRLLLEKKKRMHRSARAFHRWSQALRWHMTLTHKSSPSSLFDRSI